MAQGAVFEAEVLQLGLKRLMFASLACMVCLLKDRLARGDAGGEVATTLPAVNIELSDGGRTVSLWAFLLAEGLIER